MLLDLTGREERTRDRALGWMIRLFPRWVTADRLTKARIALCGAVLLALFEGAPLRVALALFAIAALTDLLDGPLARTQRATSLSGARLDQLADAALGGALGIAALRWGVLDPYLIGAMVLPQAVSLFAALLRRIPVSERPTTPARVQFVAVLVGFWLALLGVSLDSPAWVKVGRGFLYAEAVLAAGLSVLRAGRWYPGAAGAGPGGAPPGRGGGGRGLGPPSGPRAVHTLERSRADSSSRIASICCFSASVRVQPPTPSASRI